MIDTQYIDGSLYPDEPAPAGNLNEYQKAEHLHRVCAGWDFDLIPESETLRTLAGWKDILEKFPIPQSPAYHGLRLLFRMAPIPGAILQTTAEYLDSLEGREDPVAGEV